MECFHSATPEGTVTICSIGTEYPNIDTVKNIRNNYFITRMITHTPTTHTTVVLQHDICIP
jgi:hypothetical protein